MRTEINDYVIFTMEEKYFLGKVVKVKNNKLRIQLSGKHEADKDSIAGTKFKINHDDIITNLGKEPEPGKAYNINIEPYYESSFVRPWGKVFIFRRLAQKEKEYTLKLLKNAGKVITATGLTDHLPIDIEIRPKNGKIGGKYQIKKGETILTVCSQNLDKETVNHVVFHEFGHHMLFNHMTDQDKSVWIDLYHRSTIVVKKFSDVRLNNLRKTLVKIGSIKEFKQENADSDLFKLALKNIREIHKIGQNDLQILLNNGNNLKDYWPNVELEMSDLNLYVSQYAGKSYEEYFCESLAYYLTGKKLPKEVKKQLKITLKGLGVEIKKLNKLIKNEKN